MSVEIILDLPIIARMQTSLQRAEDREIGGVLVARQLVPGRFELMDFSVDELTGERAHFVRDPALHDSFLDEFFERTGRDYTNCNYIGEWHSHPHMPVIPSKTDLGSMENLVNSELNIPFAVLLVVRSDIPSEFLTTATFHHRGALHAPERIILKNGRIV